VVGDVIVDGVAGIVVAGIALLAGAGVTIVSSSDLWHAVATRATTRAVPSNGNARRACGKAVFIGNSWVIAEPWRQRDPGTGTAAPTLVHGK
jgi:hypothetical protein